MNYQFQSNLRRALNKDGCPATISLIVGAVIVLFVTSMAPTAQSYLLFQPGPFPMGSWPSHPWTILTGALFTGDPLMALVAIAWLWMVGGSLERSFGTRTFVGLTAGIAVITGLSLYLCYRLHLESGPLMLLVITDALTVAWGMLNRDSIVLLMFVLPLRGIVLAWLSPLFVLLFYGLPAGVFALAGCAAAWAFVTFRANRRQYRNVTRLRPRHIRRGDESIGLFGRFEAWRRNRRLAKLLRDSGVDGRDHITKM